MAMNKFMHPRNPYKKPPDFLQLTLDYPDLRKYVKPDLSGKVKINFKREGAVRELTKCLLHKDFGLSIDLPPDRLVPTLPLRMNYLLWIEDLLNESGRQFHGIDIGTGASCIYPLLAAKHFNWKMTATEIDSESIAYAVKNVEKNGLKNIITVRNVDNGTMLNGALDDQVVYDFCMCNPPFFSDESDLTGKARTERRAPPRNHPSGQNFELIAPGGETAFISRIIEDSVKLSTKIRVYTVMVGLKSNLNKIKEIVKMKQPVKIRTTEFCQGRTTRWGLAWTFSNELNLISTAIQPRKEQSKPPFRWVYPGECDLNLIKSKIINILHELSIDINEMDNDDGSCDLCLKAYENTWIHSRRKRREEKRQLVDKHVVSPCDSVVTTNESIASNDLASPSSLPDSLGYISDQPDDQCNPASLNDPNSHKKMSCNTSTDLNMPLSSPQSIEGYDNDYDKFSTLSHTSVPEEQNKAIDNCVETLEEQFSKSPKKSTKRKIESSSESVTCKKIKRSERPLLEAVLVLSDFDNDLILSLSFVDGTGGRESANQVFHYIKNKLS